MSCINAKVKIEDSYNKTAALNLKDYVSYCAATTTTQLTGSDPKGGFSQESAEDWARAVGYMIVTPSDLPSIHLPAGTRCYFDPQTSLKIVLMINEKKNELLITFGAKDSFQTECRKEEFGSYNWIQNKQIASNILLGNVPEIYTKAVEAVQKIVKLDQFYPYSKKLSGQSFGGSIAQFVGLKLEIPAIVFNSLALGAGLQKEIGLEKLNKAATFIHHLSVEGDFVSDNSLLGGINKGFAWLGCKIAASFGNRTRIASIYNNAFETHAYVMGSLGIAAGVGNPTSGKELQKFLESKADDEKKSMG